MIDASVNPNVFMHVSNFIGMENFAAGNRQWFLYIWVETTINGASIEKFLVTFKINYINGMPVKYHSGNVAQMSQSVVNIF